MHRITSVVWNTSGYDNTFGHQVLTFCLLLVLRFEVLMVSKQRDVESALEIKSLPSQQKHKLSLETWKPICVILNGLSKYNHINFFRQ